MTTTPSSTGNQSSGFNEDNFLKKLDNVTPTQDSIQSLALWIIHHKINHEIICRLWMKKLNESQSGKQRLALFYLANDVIQNCKRKNAKIFQDTFKSCLVKAVHLVRNDAIKKKIERVFDVWSERNVYDQEFVAKLTDALYKDEPTDAKVSMLTKSPPLVTKSPAATSNSVLVVTQQPADQVLDKEIAKNELEYQKIIAEFQPKKLRESITSFFALQSEVNLSKTNVEATRLLDINVEHIKQYRDKNQCAKFKTEFENSCNKLEEFIHKLNEETEQRKQLIQLLNQSEIFYDAQFKDATTVFNAYKSFGSKVTTVKRKLDDLIANKFNVNDVKLDNLDMEMSDDEEDSDLKKKSLSKNRSKSPPYLSTSASASSSSNGSIRTNLDPRQNRHSHHSHHSNKNKTNSSSSSSSSKPNQINKRKSYDDDLRIDRDRSNTPVKDEHSPVINKPIPNNTNNPLDFLTKFINKSSTSSESPIQTAAVNASNSSSSSANLSYLVDSLKKFVNTSATNNNNTNYETNSFVPQQTNTQFLYDHPLNNQTSFIQQTANPIIPQRSATPTKDELYQMPPILPPLPIDTMHNQAPGPTSPYLPQPFHPMMYPPNHPQNQMMYPMYLQAPPPPPPPMTGIPAPQMPLMMIDPNNCYQYPSTSQSNKMVISPPLSSASTTSSTSSNPIGNQANSPTGQTQYWNASNFNQMETDYDKRASFGNDSNRNDYQSPYKRKFNNYYDNDNDYNKFNNNNSGVKQQQQQQSQSFNRIPTINSQRDRGNSFSETNSNNSFNRSNSNNGANNASNSKTNRF